MKTFKFITLFFVFNSPGACVQTPADPNKGVKPLSAKTNTLSSPDALRRLSYLQTGKWQPLQRFQLVPKGYSGGRVSLSPQGICVNLGYMGQIGDEESTNQLGITVVAECVRLFPKFSDYAFTWTYTFSTGEGAYSDDVDCAVQYDRGAGTYEDLDFKAADFNDAKFFKLARENDEEIKKENEQYEKDIEKERRAETASKGKPKKRSRKRQH